MATNTNLDDTSASADQSSLSDLADRRHCRRPRPPSPCLRRTAMKLRSSGFHDGVDRLRGRSPRTTAGPTMTTTRTNGTAAPSAARAARVHHAFTAGWTTADENIFTAALTLWSHYANIHFVQVPPRLAHLLITKSYDGSADTSDDDSGDATAGGTTLDVTNSATVSIDTQGTVERPGFYSPCTAATAWKPGATNRHVLGLITPARTMAVSIPAPSNMAPMIRGCGASCPTSTLGHDGGILFQLPGHGRQLGNNDNGWHGVV